jgi:hypothetical protein
MKKGVVVDILLLFQDPWCLPLPDFPDLHAAALVNVKHVIGSWDDLDVLAGIAELLAVRIGQVKVSHDQRPRFFPLP